MIRFALVVASVLGFVLTAALGNMMVPLLRELQRDVYKRQVHNAMHLVAAALLVGFAISLLWSESKLVELNDQIQDAKACLLYTSRKVTSAAGRPPSARALHRGRASSTLLKAITGIMPI